MGLNNTALNSMLSDLDANVSHVSAHTADPGTTGTSEVTGGSYARQAISFAAPSGGSMAASNSPVIPIPSATTITHLGLWSAVSAGTFYGSADITDETFSSAGNYTITAFTVTLT